MKKVIRNFELMKYYTILYKIYLGCFYAKEEFNV